MVDAKNVESKFIGIWLDNKLMQSPEYADTQDQLQTLLQDFRKFRNSDECLDYITDINEGKIFFITSNVLGKFLVPFIHSYEQIHSIYIFHSTKSTDDELWTKQYKKIKQVFHDITLIPDRFVRDTIEKQHNDPIAISFLSSVDIHSRDVNRQDPSFMYFQLIKEILLNDHQSESDEATKSDMIAFCRQIYADDPNAIVILDEFEESFIPELAIYWYTRECFLYKVLNKALWTPEPDVLYKLRYFIRHLYYEISSQAKTQSDQLPSSMIVYRGQSMSKQQLQKLRQNVGGFLSFNNFLSTSLEKNVARNFTVGSEENGVIFEMQVDPTIEKFPMVNIELISYLQRNECEQELLFAMGSVFRIIQVEQIERNLYRVQLKLSEDVDQQLAAYTEHTRDKTEASHSFLSLLRLMNELSQYSSVDQFAEILREDVGLSSNPSILAAVHHAFGSIYHSRGQYKEALDHYQKSLNINLDFLPADHPTLTPTYNNIACVYLSQSNYNKALEFQKIAFDCASNSKDSSSSSMILYTSNLANIYVHQKKYKEALEYYKRTLELQKQHLGENDPSLAETYNKISSICFKLNDYGEGLMHGAQAAVLEATTSKSNPTASADREIKAGSSCYSQNQYQEALVHFTRALELQLQFFLPNNPTLAVTYDHLARTHEKLEQFEQALSYYGKALEVEQNSFSTDHPYIAASLHNISKTYASLSRWLEASEYSLKAVEQLKKSLKTDVSTLASYTQHVGHTYDQQKQYEYALVYYEDALELYRTHLSDDHLSLLNISYRTAEVYYKLERYHQALVLYQNVLNIQLRILPDNAKPLAQAYSDISSAYVGLKQYDEAFVAAQQAVYQALKTLPSNHPDVTQFQSNLNFIRQKQMSKNSGS